MDNLRAGLVGYGRFGKVLAEAWAGVPGTELVSVCVGDSQSEEEARKLQGVEVFTDYDEFLSKGRTDVVDIASPNYLHAQQAEKAIAAGKHVQLEKPIATKIEDARRLVNQKISSKVQVGFQYRFTPFWKEFKGNLESGVVASPTFARIEEWRGPFRTGQGGWRYDQAKVGHQFLEGAIHYFDMAAWLFGMPESVSGFSDSPGVWGEGRYGTAVAVLEYSTGLRVIVGHALNGVSDQTIASLSGEGAMIGMILSELSGSPALPWIKVREKGGAFRSRPVEDFGEMGEVRLGLQSFVDSIRSDREPLVTLRDGFNVVMLDLAAISAIQSGTAIKLSEL